MAMSPEARMMPPMKLGPSNLRPLCEGASVGAVVVASVVTLGLCVVEELVVDAVVGVGFVVRGGVGGCDVVDVLVVVEIGVVVVGKEGVTGLVGGITVTLPGTVLGDGISG